MLTSEIDIRVINASLAAILTLLVGAIPLIKRRDRLTWLFALSNLAMAIWNLGDVVVLIPGSHSAKLWLFRLNYVAAVFLVWFFYLFTFEFAQIKITRFQNVWKIMKLTGVVLIFLCLSPFLVSDIDETVRPFLEIPGPAYPLFIAFLIGGLGFALFQLFSIYRSSIGMARIRLKYMFVALIFGFIEAIIFFLALYWEKIPPYYFYLQVVYGLIVAYAIVRHRLMDIGLFIRRAALLAAIYLMLILGTLPVIVILHRAIVAQVPWTFFSLEVGLVSLVLSLGPFLYAYIIKRSAYFREYEMAGLTHELKSPLGTIQSAVEFVQENMKANPEDPRNVEYIAMIERNASRLSESVNDLLHTFQIQKNQMDIYPVPTNMNELIRGVTEVFLPRAKARGVDLQIEPFREDLEIQCDPGKIEKVLSNLISNSIKFTQQGWIKIRLKELKNSVEISVEDSGCGIPSNELPYVFDRFFQGESGKTRKGTGIGLTIARLWVEAHGGEIHVSSGSPGRGSRFWFTLPLK